MGGTDGVDDEAEGPPPSTFAWVAALVVTQLASNLLNAVVRGRAELFQERVGLAANKRILTVVLISHRLSTVRSADHIYVLDRGRVTEHGSHDDLMAAAGTYAELFSHQASAFTSP